MKRPMTCLRIFFLISVFMPVANSVSAAVLHRSSPGFISRIEGQVYDQNRNPVADVNVQLLNEVDSLVAYTKTNSVGRFTFSGISTGHFRVKVLPLGKGLSEQTQEVEVVATRAGSSDTEYVEFYLRPDKNASDTLPDSAPEAIFVQEIPKDAEKLYKNGVDDLGRNQDKGLSEIEQSINIYSVYFDALSRLGKEYVLRKDYEKAFPYLLKAIEVNPRSYSCYYRLGYAFFQLKQYPAAAETLRGAVMLVPGSIDALQLYGTVLRINENFPEAEKVLLKAKALTKEANAEIHWQLALLYNRTNKNRDAVNELEAFLKLEPNSPEKDKIEKLIEKLKTPVNPPK